MKIKDIHLYDKLVENLQYNLNEINQVRYNIQFENDERIINEMVNDLKDSLLESIKSLDEILVNNQKQFMYDNVNIVYKTLHNKNHVENLNKLYESINSNFKGIYFDNNYENEFNTIIENYIRYTQKLIDVNNELYRKEFLILSEQMNVDFNDLYNGTVTGLMEGLMDSITNILNKIKAGFGNKHDKILLRDKEWLKSNKKKILNLDYNGIELEVVNDYNITFEGLLNRHNIFDKHFVNSSNKDKLGDLLRRFEDKKGDIKNGLDNYFRTGNSKREIGLRKVAGDEAKNIVENMISYCENYLAGRKFLDEKIDNITKELSNTEVQEVTDYSQLFGYDFNPYKHITLEGFADVDLGDDSEPQQNQEQENMEDDEDMIDDNMGLEDEPVDDEENTDNMDNVQDNNRGLRDRQVGIAVLLTVAEDRYFDYIQILRGLLQE